MTRIQSGLLRVLVSAAMVLALVSVSKSAFAAAATYKAKCAMCHGADGKGDTPVGKKMGAHDFVFARGAEDDGR